MYISLGYWFLISQILFSILPLILSYDRYQFNNNYQAALLACLIAFFLFAIVYFFPKQSVKSYPAFKFVPRKERLASWTKIYLMLSPILFCCHILVAGTIPLFFVFAGSDAGDISELRELYDKNLPLLFQMMVFLNEKLIPLLLIVLTIAFSNKVRFSLILKITIFWAFLLASLGLVKGSPIILLFVIVVAKIMRMQLNPFKYFLKLLPIFLILLGIFGVLTRDANLTDMAGIIKDLVTRRIFQVQADVLIAHFSLFPSDHDFLLGRGIRLVSIILGESDFQLANYIYKGMFPDGPIDSGWANASYIGEAWADFGWWGVFVYPIIVATSLRSIDGFIKIHKETSAELNTLISTASIFFLAYLSFSSMFSTSLLLLIFFLWIFVKLFFKKTATTMLGS